jgi:hypothetical protein
MTGGHPTVHGAEALLLLALDADVVKKTAASWEEHEPLEAARRRSAAVQQNKIILLHTSKIVTFVALTRHVMAKMVRYQL